MLGYPWYDLFLLIFIYIIYLLFLIIESHGVLVQDLVGYRTLGHMFFLEDGGERMNTLERVIGISASPVAKEVILAFILFIIYIIIIFIFDVT